MELFPRMLSIDCTCKTVNILPLAEHARKFVPACDEIGSAYAQHAIKSFPRMLSIGMLQFSKMTQKSLIKMQISPTKNPNFEKPSRNLSNRTKVKILKKKFFGYLSKKFGSAYAQSPRKCSNIEILAKIEGKEAKFFLENLQRAYKDLI
jgi:hypothetical protein